MAASLFRSRDAFAEMTSRLVYEYAGSYIDGVVMEECGAAIDPVMAMRTAGMSLVDSENSPDSIRVIRQNGPNAMYITAMLEEARNTVRLNLLKDMLKGPPLRGGEPDRQMSPADRVPLVAQALEDWARDHVKLRQKPISDILERLDDAIPGWSAEFYAWHENTARLCLWCARTGEEHNLGHKDNGEA